MVGGLVFVTFVTLLVQGDLACLPEAYFLQLFFYHGDLLAVPFAGVKHGEDLGFGRGHGCFVSPVRSGG